MGLDGPNNVTPSHRPHQSGSLQPRQDQDVRALLNNSERIADMAIAAKQDGGSITGMPYAPDLFRLRPNAISTKPPESSRKTAQAAQLVLFRPAAPKTPKL